MPVRVNDVANRLVGAAADLGHEAPRERGETYRVHDEDSVVPDHGDDVAARNRTVRLGRNERVDAGPDLDRVEHPLGGELGSRGSGRRPSPYRRREPGSDLPHAASLPET